MDGGGFEVLGAVARCQDRCRSHGEGDADDDAWKCDRLPSRGEVHKAVSHSLGTQLSYSQDSL